MTRRTFDSKRALRSPAPTLAERQALVARICYTGSPLHKRNPGDFGLHPPAEPRPNKTLCDLAGIVDKATAIALLVAGAERGLISAQERGGLPQNIWAVTQDGVPVEAQLENEADGSYHGYPLPSADPFHDRVLLWWSQS